jgi:toxin FitB
MRRGGERLWNLPSDHTDRILPVTDAIAPGWGRIGSVGALDPVAGLIAATVTVHDLILVARNG